MSLGDLLLKSQIHIEVLDQGEEITVYVDNQSEASVRSAIAAATGRPYP